MPCSKASVIPSPTPIAFRFNHVKSGLLIKLDVNAGTNFFIKFYNKFNHLKI